MYYAKLVDGAPSIGHLFEEMAQQIVGPDFNVSDMTADELASKDLCRVVNPDPPLNGYVHSLAGSSVQDGVWTLQWQQEDTPGRDASLKMWSDNRRGARNSLLSECDWTQLSDANLTEEEKSAWSDYRTQLRDMPLQDGFPWSVTWPAKPA